MRPIGAAGWSLPLGGAVTELCGDPHPDHPHITCDKTKPCFAYHQSAKHRMTWGERELPLSQTSDPGRLVDMARQIRSNQ